MVFSFVVEVQGSKVQGSKVQGSEVQSSRFRGLGLRPSGFDPTRKVQRFRVERSGLSYKSTIVWIRNQRLIKSAPKKD